MLFNRSYDIGLYIVERKTVFNRLGEMDSKRLNYILV